MVVISPEDLPIITWQETSNTDDLSVIYVNHDRFGADILRVSVLFQVPVGETIKFDNRNLVGFGYWFRQIWTLVLGVRSYHDWYPVSCSEPAHWSTWVKDEIYKGKIDPNLYSEIQRTIRSVTASLIRTTGINFVIFDLLGLTQMLSNTASDRIQCYGVQVLLRLIAPIAPTFAEECWEIFHWHHAAYRNDKLSQFRAVKAKGLFVKVWNGTIFEQSYPIPVDVSPPSDHKAQNCEVLEDGLLRFVAVIPIPSKDFTEKIDAAGLRDWVLEHVQKTEEWKEFEETVPTRLRRRVVVANGTKTVNFIP